MAEEGLGEIEEVDPRGDVVIKQPSTNAYRGADPLEIELRLAFFLACSSMVQSYKFKRPIDRIIMEHYCEGKTKEEIRAELIKLGVTFHRQWITEIVRKHLIIFGLYGK